ncbi:MAG TPA: M2 family metallopeptidase, partial [Bacteroidota bacterium]|nr:M2 family metallopeptidase [Bacteroidota bacterium]
AMQNDEQELRAFIDNHVKTVEPKFKAMNLASWNASATGEKKYYDEQAATEIEVRTIYSNKTEFAQLKKWMNAGTIQDPILRRQLILLYNSYLPNQIDSALMRKIVEKSAEIANKFNTFRGIIDGKEVSDNDIDDILQKETDSAKRQKAWEASKTVGKAIAPMLIELVKLRNEAARQLGYKNFYEMSLIAAEQSEEEIVKLFDELAALTDAPFTALKSDIDTKLAAKWNIQVNDMKPWHYQDRFFQEAPQISGVDLDQYFKDKKVEQLAQTYYTQLDLPVDNIVKNSDLYGRTGKYQHAFETDIDRKGDIRVMLSIVNNQYWMSTILHELGHAAYSNNVKRDLPFLLRSETHIFFTEAIAMMMERQASNADWLSTMVGIPASENEAIRKAGEESLRMHGLIFSRWTQVMMRFERGMYQNPDQDLNKLWWDLVEQYQHIKRPEGRNEPDWAAKIHLSQSPVYYHNYELGELTASQLQHYIAANVLKQTDTKNVCFAGKPAIGDYLKKYVFNPGASLRWDELMKYATGEPLTAKYFAEEFVK